MESLPELGQVKDQLDPEEIVEAKDYEVEFEADIDLKKDFTNMQVPGQVKVTFYEAKNADKADFSTGTPGTYKAVYYAEPMNEMHPVYRISRNIIVKEPVTEAQSAEEEADDSEDPGSETVEAATEEPTAAEETESIDPEEEEPADTADLESTVPETEEPVTADPEATIPEADPSSAAPETESTAPEPEAPPEVVVISAEEMDEMLEEAETQDTYDEESGWTVSGVIQWATEEEEIDLSALGFGETASFEVPRLRGAKASLRRSIRISPQARDLS